MGGCVLVGHPPDPEKQLKIMHPHAPHNGVDSKATLVDQSQGQAPEYCTFGRWPPKNCCRLKDFYVKA